MLNAGDKLVEHEDFYLERLGINYKIRTITADEHKDIFARCKKYLNLNGNLTETVDGDRVARLVLILATVSPKWNDSRIIAKYGSAEEAIPSILRPGEIIQMSDRIMMLSGFQSDVKTIDSIKKS
jgi:hypothetical protein